MVVFCLGQKGKNQGSTRLSSWVGGGGGGGGGEGGRDWACFVQSKFKIDLVGAPGRMGIFTQVTILST